MSHGPDGFSLSTADGLYRLGIGGYVQTRYVGNYIHGEYDGGFRIERARWILGGKAGDDLTYRTMVELAGAPHLLDAYLDWRAWGRMSIRVGRDKVPFSRGALTPAASLTLPERSAIVDALRWARDIGVALHYTTPRMHWQLSFGNGAVDGAVERIPSVATRIQWAVSGEVIDGTREAGDLTGTPQGATTIGFNGIVDAVLPPATIGDLVIDPDADDDGKPGRIVTAAGGMDLTIRGGGFEAIMEILYRHEDWSEILRANADLAEIVGREPVRRYAGMYIDASYMVWPQYLMLAGRVGYGDLPFMSMRGPSRIPPGQQVLEVAGGVVLYHEDHRLLSASYTVLDYYEGFAVAGAAELEQRGVVELQLTL